MNSCNVGKIIVFRRPKVEHNPEICSGFDMTATSIVPDQFGTSRSEFGEAQTLFVKNKTEFDEIKNQFGK